MCDGILSDFDETINQVNLHNGFCMTHLLWESNGEKMVWQFFCPECLFFHNVMQGNLHKETYTMQTNTSI